MLGSPHATLSALHNITHPYAEYQLAAFPLLVFVYTTIFSSLFPLALGFGAFSFS
jgi:hypothetical protein